MKSMPRHRPRQTAQRPGDKPTAEGQPEKGQAQPQQAQPRPARAWQPRFGIGGMFLVVSIVSVMAAAGFYLVRMIFATRPQDGRSAQLAFLLFTMAAPPLLVVLLAAFIAFIRRR